MTAREFVPPPSTGFAVIDRFLGRGAHPSNVARAKDQFMPGVLKSWTSAGGGERVLRDALRETGAGDILALARAEHDAQVSKLRDIAESLPAFAEEAAQAALAAVIKDPTPKTAAALLSARAQLAEAGRTADFIEKFLEDSEQAFIASEPHRMALVKVFKAITQAFKKSDTAVAVRLAFRAAVLIEALTNGHPGALIPAMELVNGHIGDTLDLGLIPVEWVEKGCAPGFRWDESDLVFA